jgi:hypothetical protein
MRKAFHLRPVQTRSSVSRSSGTYMKMLAPFGLKYYRPHCMFLPRNLCIMRGEIDYVASNRSVDPRGVRSTPSDGMSDIWHRVDGPELDTTRRTIPRGRLPHWVQLGSGRARSACPLYPQEQTLSGHPGMSEKCQTRTSPLHSITSSAIASILSGMTRPSALAVLRLTTRSNLVGCSTGRSPGFAPRRILSTKSAARRNKAGKFGP